MRFFFLLLFIVAGAVHLYASYRRNKKMRAGTKWLLLPALLGWYCCSVAAPSWIVIMALVMSWLGDVLLIFHGNRWFSAGGIAFAISHLFFSLSYAPQIEPARVPWWLALPALAAYLLAVLLLFRSYRPHLPRALFYPMLVYLAINGAMNCCALFQFVSLPSAATAVTYVGALLFFLSDATLFSVRFNKASRWKSHFPVMLTYLFAEYLIMQGLIWLQQAA